MLKIAFVFVINLFHSSSQVRIKLVEVISLAGIVDK